MLKLLLVSAFLGCALNIEAQVTGTSVLSSGGGSISGSQISIDFTVGESFTEYITSDNTIISIGFHQPQIEEAEVITPGDFFAFPNPAFDYLYVGGPDQKSPLYIRISDLTGRIFYETSTDLLTDKIPLYIDSMPEGFFILELAQNAQNRTFKIFKID